MSAPDVRTTIFSKPHDPGRRNRLPYGRSLILPVPTVEEGFGKLLKSTLENDRCLRTWQIRAPTPAIDLKTLHAKIGELTLENDFLSGALGKAGMLSAKR